MAKLNFNPYFQRLIIKFILKADWAYVEWLQHINPEYFTISSYVYLVEKIKEIYSNEKFIPTPKILVHTIETDSSLDERTKTLYLRTLHKIIKQPSRVAEKEFVLHKLATFIRRQQYLLCLDKSVSLIENNDIKELDKIFYDCISLGNAEKGKRGMMYFQDVDSRVFNSKHRQTTYPMLISGLDGILRHGGMRPGETVFWLATSGAGKTMALVHSTRAWLLQKLKGVYYTLQLTEQDIAERLDSSFSNVPIKDLNEQMDVVKTKVAKLGKRYGESLVIKYLPRRKSSIEDIAQHLYTLREAGFDSQFIAVDFLNYLNPAKVTIKDNSGRYYAAADAAGEFITLCQQEHLLGAVGVQARRAAANADLTTLEDVAESWGSIMDATLVVSINRTPEERMEEKARLYICKYSFGQDHLIVPINTNYAKGSLYRKI